MAPDKPKRSSAEPNSEMSATKHTGTSAHRAPLFIIGALIVLLAAIVAGFLFGSSSVSAGDLFTWATGGEISNSAKSILVNVRLPRVLSAVLAGAALACAGAIIQAVLDNPMASPNIIGINSGAGLAVLVAASLFPNVEWVGPIAAFAGAVATALIVFAISLSSGTSKLTVILAGIAITSIFSAGMNTILIVNPDAYIGSSTFLVGGLSSVKMKDILWPAAYIACALPIAFISSGRLNLMSLGDTTAHSLGMHVQGTRLAMLALASVLAGAAVSFAGLLGFVGLIIPHLVRFFVGHDNRVVLPLSSIVGSAFVVICDLLARVMFAPYELPVGILMAFIGGPFFIYLILKNRKGGLGGSD